MIFPKAKVRLHCCTSHPLRLLNCVSTESGVSQIDINPHRRIEFKVWNISTVGYWIATVHCRTHFKDVHSHKSDKSGSRMTHEAAWGRAEGSSLRWGQHAPEDALKASWLDMHLAFEKKVPESPNECELKNCHAPAPLLRLPKAAEPFCAMTRSVALRDLTASTSESLKTTMSMRLGYWYRTCFLKELRYVGMCGNTVLGISINIYTHTIHMHMLYIYIHNIIYIYA
jgi:hypothetical protein